MSQLRPLSVYLMSMDRKRFGNMASQLRPKLIGLLIRMGADETTAEDVVQDTLLKLWSLGDKLDGYTSPEALATVIARNRLTDILRSDHTDITPDNLTTLPAERSMESDHNINRTDSRRYLDALLDALPDGQRVILTMRHIQGMEIADIASTLDCSETSVRSSLSRARTRLKALTLKYPDL